MITIKKFTIIVFMFLSIFMASIFSCGDQDIPVIVVNEYYESLHNGNFERAYQKISKLDKKYRSLSSFKGKGSSTYDIKKKIWSLIDWEIKDCKVGTDKAEVSVIFKMPNIGEILGENIGSTLASLETFENDKEAFRSMKNGILLRLSSEELEYKYINERINLLYEEGKWKIFFDWEKEEKIRTGIYKAIELRRNTRIDEAIDTIQRVLEIDKNNQIAKEYLRLLKDQKGRER